MAQIQNNAVPAQDAAAITQSDESALPTPAKALWIGATGSVRVITLAGTTVTFTGVQAGTVLPISVRQVMDTGTDITDGDMLALLQ